MIVKWVAMGVGRRTRTYTVYDQNAVSLTGLGEKSGLVAQFNSGWDLFRASVLNTFVSIRKRSPVALWKIDADLS